MGYRMTSDRKVIYAIVLVKKKEHYTELRMRKVDMRQKSEVVRTK